MPGFDSGQPSPPGGGCFLCTCGADAVVNPGTLANMPEGAERRRGGIDLFRGGHRGEGCLEVETQGRTRYVSGEPLSIPRLPDRIVSACQSQLIPSS